MKKEKEFNVVAGIIGIIILIIASIAIIKFIFVEEDDNDSENNDINNVYEIQKDVELDNNEEETKSNIEFVPVNETKNNIKVNNEVNNTKENSEVLEGNILQKNVNESKTSGDIFNIRDEVNLVVQKYSSQYYENYMINQENYSNVGDYIANELRDGEKIEDGYVEVKEQKIIVYKDSNKSAIVAEGTLNENGYVIWE